MQQLKTAPAPAGAPAVAAPTGAFTTTPRGRGVIPVSRTCPRPREGQSQGLTTPVSRVFRDLFCSCPRRPWETGMAVHHTHFTDMKMKAQRQQDLPTVTRWPSWTESCFTKWTDLLGRWS